MNARRIRAHFSLMEFPFTTHNCTCGYFNVAILKKCELKFG